MEVYFLIPKNNTKGKDHKDVEFNRKCCLTWLPGEYETQTTPPKVELFMHRNRWNSQAI